ncbi:HAD family hydrolase [Paraburkholderia phenoliruptrix]|uniref:HAD family hydrolase n=1 Tax=Paraburkholderia phenoliruptrix TaxID=252970 RepID=UPI002869A0CD|nr:HAD-IA family hydrolase [Paraburkholderia phenoliruptrix]WMY11822.1 HAD-IA family hydrolase [Paraburkholderia phenoliruptrix]
MDIREGVSAGLRDVALICDCDGVLVDSEAIAGVTIVRELETLWPGVEVESVVTPLLGFRTEHVLQQTAATLGKTLTPEQIGAIHTTVGAAAIKAPMVRGIDAALGSIPFLKACASNSYSAYVAHTVDRTGLRRFFEGRLFTADLVPNPKPAPDVYLFAAKHIAVAPARCLVVEDSVAGATAAVSAGMSVLGYAGGAHDPEEQASKLRKVGVDITFNHMSDLPGLARVWARKFGFSWPSITVE